MKDTTLCPVPDQQIPSEEYRQLTTSWFFAWPTKPKNYLYKALLISWLTTLPIAILIASGSWELKNNATSLLTLSILANTLCPILIILRQWMGWGYVFRRLNSEKIVYEESGWYDGQVWEKCIELRTKELLIAQHDVKPIIRKLTKLLLSLVLLSGIGIYLFTI